MYMYVCCEVCTIYAWRKNIHILLPKWLKHYMRKDGVEIGFNFSFDLWPVFGVEVLWSFFLNDVNGRYGSGRVYREPLWI